ncbi:MAG: hypothetical protein GXO36_04015, partial [Chloroflexi bacterium]|nr:hypothetical protein [Chloroflexota bacterium]
DRIEVEATPREAVTRAFGPVVMPPTFQGDALAFRTEYYSPTTRYLILRLDAQLWFYRLHTEQPVHVTLDMAQQPLMQFRYLSSAGSTHDVIVEILRHPNTSFCTDAPPSPFQVGMVGHTCHRRKILLWSKASPRSQVLASLAPNTRFEVIDGPECGAKRVWWKVRLSPPFSSVEGWMPETSVGGRYRYLCPGEPPVQLPTLGP